MKRRIISISIAGDLLEELDEASRVCNMSKSRFIENLLIKALDIKDEQEDTDGE